MLWHKTGDTRYYAQVRYLYKGRANKGLVVYHGRDVSVLGHFIKVWR